MIMENLAAWKHKVQVQKTSRWLHRAAKYLNMKEWNLLSDKLPVTTPMLSSR